MNRRSTDKHPTIRRAWLFLLALIMALATSAAVALPALAAEMELPLFRALALTEDAPVLVDGVYQISDAAELAWFRDLVNGTLTDGTPQNAAANAVLVSDIDMSTVSGATAGPDGTALSWTPVGTSTANYTGDFNGNGKKLTNLYINATTTNSGLFGYNSGIIRNLTIASGTIKSTASYLGSLAARNLGKLYYCANLVDVQSSSTYVGGLVGANTPGAISHSVNKGNVSTTNSGTTTYTGGIAGATNSGGAIANSYNTGDVTSAGQRAGGITGMLGTTTTLTDCYNAGNVSAANNRGGVIGYATAANFLNSTASNNYFLQTETVNAGLAAIGAGGATATSAQATFVDEAGLQGLAATLGSVYSPDGTPSINNGYPVLSWQLTNRLFVGFAATPSLDPDLSQANVYYNEGDQPAALSVTASVSDDGTLSYQWFRRTTGSDAATTAIGGANAAGYTPSAATAGTTYYFVLVTNTKSAELDPVTVKSAETPVTVFAADADVPARVGNVFQIGDAEQLAWFRDLVNGTLPDGTPQDLQANAKLTADIDMSSVCGATAGPGGSPLSWTPIAAAETDYEPYLGDFDGNGKRLTNLYIDATSDYSALFGCNFGLIRNLTIASGSLDSSGSYSASLVGVNAGDVYYCVNLADVRSSSTYVGGLVGHNLASSTVACSLNKGSVSSTSTSSSAYAGGIAASSSSGAIDSCYNTGSVSLPDGQRAGGIVGTIANGTTLIDSYNAGNVSAKGSRGGVIGYATDAQLSTSTVGNTYFLQTASVNAGLKAVGTTGTATAAQAAPVDDAGLQGLAATLGSAFSPDGDPTINNGYPVLSWQLTHELLTGLSQKPVISTDLNTSVHYWTQGSSNTLTVAVQPITDGGELSYQWYGSTTSATEGFTPVATGGNAAGYSPSTASAGTAYYYATITNTTGDKMPLTVKSAVATIAVTTPLTVKIDGVEYTGARLQDIVESQYPGGRDAALDASRFEIVSGTFIAADAAYLLYPPSGLTSDPNTNTGVTVIFNGPPAVDISLAFPDASGLNCQYNPKMFRMEIPGLKTLGAWGTLGTDGTKLPTLYAPDLETISYTGSIGSFYNSKVTTLYLPHIKTIGSSAFSAMQNTALQTVILPGDMPAIASDAFTVPWNRGGKQITLWVPANKVEAYTDAVDMGWADPDGKTAFCIVKAIPAGVKGDTDAEWLKSFAMWAVARVPALNNVTPAHEEAIYLARDLVSTLPQSVASGMESEVEKAYAAYDRLRPVLLDDIETRIASLPDVGEVTADDRAVIEGVWNDYNDFNPAFKSEIPGASVTRLNQVFSNLAEVMFDYYMGNGTPFVSIDALADGTKRVNHGDTFAEFQYSTANSYLAGATTHVGRGDFTAADFFNNYRPQSVVIASEEVSIGGGVLAGDNRLSSRLTRLELPTVTRLETQALRSINYAPDWYLVLPNVVSMDADAYYDSHTSQKNKAALYLPLMAKLEDCKTILRADKPLMLPRLTSGERVFYATPQEYVLLPALTNAGSGFFADSTALKAAWLPEATKIDGSAFSGSSITELYVGETPPAVLGTGDLDSTNDERTVYVPTGAQDAYKAVDDGDTSDDAWYGWAVRPFSASTTVADLLNAYIAALPTGSDLTHSYLEWLGQMADAREALTEAQRAKVDNATLDNALAAVAALGSEEEIANVEALIEALGDPAGVTLAQRAAIEAARVAFDALSKPAQLQVENRDDLFAAEAALRPLILADLHERIAEIPDVLTRNDIEFVRAVYSGFLGLTDDEKAQLAPDDVEKLNAAVDKVVQIEADLLRAAALETRIEALPAASQIKLKNESAIKSIRATYERLSARARGYVAPEALARLVAAEARIAELKGLPADQKTIYVAIEKFTLGQGYVQTPVPVTITPESSPNVAAIVLDVIGEGKCRHSGSVANSFYLQAVKDDDRSEAVIPQYILDRVVADLKTVGVRSEQDWLGEMDYTDMSGWMYAVNGVSPSVGASSYTYAALNSGDVIRWQFTVYGYGADLGFDFAGSKYWDVADKDELTAEIAKVDASPEKSVWLQDGAYAAAYADAHSVIGSMTSTQAQVDACVAALRNRPSTSDLGTVTVSVRDVAPRRQAISTFAGGAIQFENLTGLGNYQVPFGQVIENVVVPITAGMNVREAVIAALEGKGYAVTTASGRITGVGPLATPDRSATVAELAKGDAGDRSKWVLSQNGYAIADSEAAGDFLVRDGDQLSLDYSVDGGFDVGCFPYTSTYFTIAFSLDARLKGSATTWDMYVPEGSDSLAITYTRQGPSGAPDLYNRAHKLFIESHFAGYRSGETIPVAPGQSIELTVSNPMSAGGNVYNSINDMVTGSGVDRILTLTVKYLKTPAHLQEAIEALPALEELDYDQHNGTITELQAQYSLFTQDEKDDVSVDAVAKLQAAAARMTELYNADNQKVDQIVALVNGYYGKITAANYAEHADAVAQSLALYGELNGRVAAAFEETVPYLRMMSSKELIDRYIAGDTSTIGVPTDYENDFLLTANAFNLDLGKADDAYQVVFLDTPRIGNAGFHLPGWVQFEIKDPSIFEIREVPYTYVDQGLGGGGQYPSVKYYLVPRKAGTTTFTCTFDGFSGQTPEMVVHVNDSAESAVEGLAEKLTNISALSKTTKYDTWYYFAGRQGAPFSFKVNGSDPTVSVYGYLSYDAAGAATRTEYPVDADGSVTVLLKDGYNPIEVTATYNGQRVTQVYGLKGKVISYGLSNVTSPDAATFKEGDTVSLQIKGLAWPVSKMLRIYNPSATQFWFDTNLPRYDIIKSGGGQYTATEMQFVLTGSGDVVLRNGRIFQDWFGSPLYSETDTGNTGEGAPQSKTTFSHIPDVHLTVADNPDYNPALVTPQIVGGATVKAGTTATISIPGLDTASLLAQYSLEDTDTYNDFLKGVTQFATDIPNCAIRSKVVQTTDDINDLKTLEFSVPASTAPGEYRIYGGRVDVTYGISWWMRYADAFVTQIADLTIQVTPSDIYLDLYLAKSDAKAALDAYADPDDYRPAQQTELASAVAAGKEAIDQADDTEAVAAALAEAKEAIDAIKTDAELTAEEEGGEDQAAIAAAKAAVEGATYEATQAQAPDEAGALARVSAVIDALDLGGAQAAVTKVSYAAPVAGTEQSPEGTGGAYVFTVALSKGTGTEQVTDELTLLITATAYESPPQESTPLADATVKLATRADGALTWTGKQLRPAVTVKLGGASCEQGGDFTVSYGANTAVGKGTVTLTATAGGALSGKRTLTFTIVPKATRVKALKVGKKRLTVSFPEVTAKLRLSRYKVSYRLAGSSTWKTKLVTSSYTDKKTVATRTLTGLKAGKRYQVTVKAGKQAGGTWYWSPAATARWSAKVR